MLLSLSLLRHVDTLPQGELRAEFAMHAARRTSELLYRPYATVLYKLWGVTRGKEYDNADYGVVVNNLLAQSFGSAYPALLNARAVLVRNSVAHDNWDYFYDQDAVEMRDGPKGPPKN